MKTENSTTISTPYDSVFRTLITDCPALVIPLVNEMFGEHYTGLERIEPLQNERFVRGHGSEEDKIITDSYIVITSGSSKRYHIECQSIQDGTILIRIFEYDAQLAVADSLHNSEKLKVRFPNSGVLYLRHNSRTPDTMHIEIEAPDGNSVTYEVHVLKAQMYTIEDIFSKRLYFLIPFHLFVFEKDLPAIESDPARLETFMKHYANIRKHLEDDCSDGILSMYDMESVIGMTERIANAVAEKYSTVRKGVTKTMGGEILDYPAKTILRQGIAQGREEGLQHAAKVFSQKYGITEEEAIQVLHNAPFQSRNTVKG